LTNRKFNVVKKDKNDRNLGEDNDEKAFKNENYSHINSVKNI
jgi:hypothetical protein